MKRIGLIAAVGFLLAISAHCAADSTTQPTSQQSKAETFLLVDVKGTIGEDFPNTAAAKEAKEQIKQLLEDEAKKAGKGS